jgi:hypothetical protein
LPPHAALHWKLNFAFRKKFGGSIDFPLEERGGTYIDAADTISSVVWRDAQRRRVGAGAASAAGDCDEGDGIAAPLAPLY